MLQDPPKIVSPGDGHEQKNYKAHIVYQKKSHNKIIIYVELNSHKYSSK